MGPGRLAFAASIALFLIACGPARMATVSRSERTEEGKKTTHVRVKIQHGRFTFQKNGVTVSSNDPLTIVDEGGAVHIHQFDVERQEVLLCDGRTTTGTYALLDVARDKVVRLRFVNADEGKLIEEDPVNSEWLKRTLEAGGMTFGGGKEAIIRSVTATSDDD